MPKQTRLANFVKCKGRDFKGKWPKYYLALSYVFVEDKLDGLRCIVIFKDNKANAYTSSGVLIPNATEICKPIEKALKGQSSQVFDGEMHCKDWNTTVGIMKTQEFKPELANKANFRVFDLLLYRDWQNQTSDPKLPLKLRKKLLHRKVKEIGNKRITVIAEVKAKPKTEVMQKLLARAVKRGAEGIMIKHPNMPYDFRTGSPNWLKMKTKKDADLEILDCIPGTKGKRNEHRVGALVLKGKVDGKMIATKCGGGMTDKNRDDLWKLHKKGKLVGRFATFEHEGRTAKDALRFPQFKRLHEEK